MNTNIKLKTISREGIPEAIAKAERYRLLNEPMQSESICTDILDIDPDNQKAIITMLLSLTDQYGKFTSVDINRAAKLVPKLESEYERYYYAGIICERRAVAILNQGSMGSDADAYEWFVDAMTEFENAEKIRPSGNDDAILRWNTCARQIMSRKLEPREVQYTEPPLE